MKVFNLEPTFHKTQIQNLKLITEHHPYCRSVSVGVFIAYGSRHEKRGENGIAHLMEHIVFKGSENYTAFELNQKIEGLGGEINAFTTKEFTCFHSNVLSEHLEVALEILSEISQKALFTEKDLEKEKEVILQEIEADKDDPEQMICNMFCEKIYKGHPLSQPILGTAESLASIKFKNLEDNYKKEYKSLLISIAGNVDHKESLEFVNKYFKTEDTVYEKAPLHPPVFQHFSKTVDSHFQQSHLLLGFEAPTFSDEDRFTAQIFTTLLGNGMTSRLYQLLREKKALVYSVNSYLNQTNDSGLVLISSAATASNLDLALELIHKELMDLKLKGVTDKELHFFKEQFKGELILASSTLR